MQKRNHFHRLQQKRYSRGAYRNPYFQAPKTPKNKYLIIGAASTFLFVAFLMYLFTYPAFKIRSVEIRGLQASSNTQMETGVREYLGQSHLFIFHNTNRFLFSKKTLQTFLEKTFAFDQIDIKLKKQTIYLVIKERTSDIVWKTNKEFYLADLQGIVTQKIDAIDPSKPLPIIVDRNNKLIAIGDQILSEERIKQILAFHKLLSSQGISFTETQIDLQVGKWMGVLTTQGFYILFDPDSDLNSQSERLKALLQGTIKDVTKLQYIDLRFGDHVYYK
jgi:hypothetical protein